MAYQKDNTKNAGTDAFCRESLLDRVRHYTHDHVRDVVAKLDDSVLATLGKLISSAECAYRHLPETHMAEEVKYKLMIGLRSLESRGEFESDF